MVAIAGEAEAELYCSYILSCEQKSMAHKRKVPSSIYSQPSEVNNGHIMNVGSLKKDFPEEKRLE